MRGIATVPTDSTVNLFTSRNRSFIRPSGNPSRLILGTGNAVFLGGVTLVDPTGVVVALVRKTSVWIWPGILVGLWGFIVGLIVVLVDAPWWVTLGLVAFLSVLLLGAAVVALLLALRGQRSSLFVDARRRTCEERDGGRTVLSIPAEGMQRVRVQVFANSSYGDVYNVLIDLGTHELWIHQVGLESEAFSLARALAGALQIRLDSQLQRVS